MQWICFEPIEGTDWSNTVEEATLATPRKVEQLYLVEVPCSEFTGLWKQLSKFSPGGTAKKMFSSLNNVEREVFARDGSKLSCGRVERALKAADIPVILCELVENNFAVFTVKKGVGSSKVGEVIAALKKKMEEQPKNVKFLVMLDPDETFPGLKDPTRELTVSGAYAVLANRMKNIEFTGSIEQFPDEEKGIFRLVCESEDEAKTIIDSMEGGTMSLLVGDPKKRFKFSLRYEEDRPIVLDDIFTGIREAADKSHQVDCVSGKGATMMLGVTQSGKTTTLAYAIGLVMEIAEHNKVRCIAAVDPTRGEVAFVSNPDRETFLRNVALPRPEDWPEVPVPEGFQLAYVSSLPPALGKGLNPFAVATTRQNESTTKDVFAFSSQVDGEEVLIVDTPGTKDSEGLRVDVRNACVKQKLFETVSAMKIVITIQSKWIQNGADYLYEALDTMIPYFTNWTLDCANVGVIVTKLVETEFLSDESQATTKIAEAMATLRDLAESCKKSCKRDAHKRFLEHIVENLDKTDPSQQRVWGVNPLKKDGGLSCRRFVKNLPGMASTSFRTPLPPNGIKFVRNCVEAQAKSFIDAVSKEAYEEARLIKEKVESAKSQLETAKINYSYFPYSDWTIQDALNAMVGKVTLAADTFAKAFLRQISNKAYDNASENLQSLKKLHETFGTIVDDPVNVMQQGRVEVQNVVAELEWVTMPPNEIESWETVRGSIQLIDRLMSLCGGGDAGTIHRADEALASCFQIVSTPSDAGFDEELEKSLSKFVEGFTILNEMTASQPALVASRAEVFVQRKSEILSMLNRASFEIGRYFDGEVLKTTTSAAKDDSRIEVIISNLEKISRCTLVATELGDGNAAEFRRALMHPIEEALKAIKDPAKDISSGSTSEIVGRMKNFVRVAEKMQRLQSHSAGIEAIRNNIRTVLRKEIEDNTKDLEGLLRSGRADVNGPKSTEVCGHTISGDLDNVLKMLAAVDVLQNSGDSDQGSVTELSRPLRIVKQWAKDLTQGGSSVKKIDTNIATVLTNLRQLHACRESLLKCQALDPAASEFTQSPFESASKLAKELLDMKQKVTETVAKMNTELTDIVASLKADLALQKSESHEVLVLHPVQDFAETVQQLGQLVGPRGEPLPFLEGATAKAIGSKVFQVQRTFKGFYDEALNFKSFFEQPSNHHLAARFIEFLAVKMRNIEEIKVEQVGLFEAMKKLGATEDYKPLSSRITDFLDDVSDTAKPVPRRGIARALKIVRETMRGLRMYATDFKQYSDDLAKREETLKQAIERRQLALQTELAHKLPLAVGQWTALLGAYGTDELVGAEEEMADFASSAGRQGLSIISQHWKTALQSIEEIVRATGLLQFAFSVLDAIIVYKPDEDTSERQLAVETFQDKRQQIVNRFHEFCKNQVDQITKQVKRGLYDKAADATSNFESMLKIVRNAAEPLVPLGSCGDEIIKFFTTELDSQLARLDRETDEDFSQLASVITFCERNDVASGVAGAALAAARERLNTFRRQIINDVRDKKKFDQLITELEEIDKEILAVIRATNKGEARLLDLSKWDKVCIVRDWPEECKKEIERFCDRLLHLFVSADTSSTDAEDILLLQAIGEFERVCDSVKPKREDLEKRIQAFRTKLIDELRAVEKEVKNADSWPNAVSTIKKVADWLFETSSVQAHNNGPLFTALTSAITAFETQLLRGRQLTWKHDPAHWKILYDGIICFGNFKPVRDQLISQQKRTMTLSNEAEKALSDVGAAAKKLEWSEAAFVCDQFDSMRSCYTEYQTVKKLLCIEDSDISTLYARRKKYLEVKQQKDDAEKILAELVDGDEPKLTVEDLPQLDLQLETLRKPEVIEFSKTLSAQNSQQKSLDKIVALSYTLLGKCERLIQERDPVKIETSCAFFQIARHLQQYTRHKDLIESLQRAALQQLKHIIDEDIIVYCSTDFTAERDQEAALKLADIAIALGSILDNGPGEMQKAVKSSSLAVRHKELVQQLEGIFATPAGRKKFSSSLLDRLQGVETILHALDPTMDLVSEKYKTLGTELLTSLSTTISKEENIFVLFDFIATEIFPPTESSALFVDAINTRGQALLQKIADPAAFNTVVGLQKKVSPLKNFFPKLSQDIDEALKSHGGQTTKAFMEAFKGFTSSLDNASAVANFFGALTRLKQYPSLQKEVDACVRQGAAALFEGVFFMMVGAKNTLQKLEFPDYLKSLLGYITLISDNAEEVAKDPYLNDVFTQAAAKAPWTDREVNKPLFTADLGDIRSFLTKIFESLINRAKVVLQEVITPSLFDEKLEEYSKFLSLISLTRKANVVHAAALDSVDVLVSTIPQKIIQILVDKITTTCLFDKNQTEGEEASKLHSGAIKFKDIAVAYFSHSVQQQQVIEKALAQDSQGVMLSALLAVCQQTLDVAAAAIKNVAPVDLAGIKTISSKLCSIRARAAYFVPATDMVEKCVSTLVDNLSLKDEEMKLLYDELYKEPGGDGIAIVSLPIFASCELAVLNNYCKDQLTPEAILVKDKRVTLYDAATPAMVVRLQELLEGHQKCVAQLLEKYSKNNDLLRSIKDLRSDVLELSTRVKQKSLIGDLVQLITLTAFSFTWLREGKGYLKHKNPQYLPALHSIQMSVLFLIFECEVGAADTSSQFLIELADASRNSTAKFKRNHLIEVLTGEGKSISLAVCAAVVALVGHPVDIVCFSRVLTDRDREEHDFFFKQLNLTSANDSETNRKVRYLTFDDVMEWRVGKLRGAALATVMNTQETFERPTLTRRVLLLDETDTVLSENFYGKNYESRARLHHSHIAELIRYVYGHRRSGKAALRDIEGSPPFLNVLSLLGPNCWNCPQLEPVLIHAVRLMVEQVRDFGVPINVPGIKADSTKFGNYFVSKKDGIGYTRGDGVVSFHSSNGYATAFAYLAEVDAGRVTASEALEKHHMSLLISLAEFPYCTLPSDAYFACFGVTGTLSTLCPDELQALGDAKMCNFKKISKTKSIYQRGADQAAVVEHGNIAYHNSRADWGVAIAKIIEDRRKQTREGNNKGFPVIVVFQNKEEMEIFLAEGGRAYAKDCQRLTPDTPTAEATVIVKNATLKGKVTLMTRDFGRGLDFKCRTCEKLTIVQAFFAASLSEEVQIRGRTARQGQPGQYFMHFLLDQAAAELGVRPQVVVEHFNKRVVDNTLGSEKYDVLTELRSAKIAAFIAGKKSEIERSAENTSRAMRLVNSVLDFTRSRDARLKSVMQPINANNGVRHSFIYIVDASDEMNLHQNSGGVVAAFWNGWNRVTGTRWGQTRLTAVGETMKQRHKDLKKICNHAYDLASIIAVNDVAEMVQKPNVLRDVDISNSLDLITGAGRMCSSVALQALARVVRDLEAEDVYAKTHHHVVMLTFGNDSDESEPQKIAAEAAALRGKGIASFSIIQIGENPLFPNGLKESLKAAADIELKHIQPKDRQELNAAINKCFSLVV